MHAYDLSKLVIAPDIHGEVGVWDTTKSRTAPVPVGEKHLVRLVWQLAEQNGAIRIFATNDQCQAWLRSEED